MPGVRLAALIGVGSGLVAVGDPHVDPGGRHGGGESGQEGGADASGDHVGGFRVGDIDVNGFDSSIRCVHACAEYTGERPEKAFRLSQQFWTGHDSALALVHAYVLSGNSPPSGGR